MSHSTCNGLLESLLNDSSLNLSQIKNIYASFEEYQINLCSITDENTSLSKAFSFIGKIKKYFDCFMLILNLEKFELQSNNEFGDFLNLPAPKTALTCAIQEFGSCELDEKAFIQEVIHESNCYNEIWLQE